MIKIKKISATDKDFYDHYRNNAKHRNINESNRHSKYSRVINSFWTKVGERMTDTKGGVFIDSFGYFCVGMTMKKTLLKKKGINDIYVNGHTDNYIYYPLFIPDRNVIHFRVFTMDRCFTNKIRKTINKRLKAGFKYLNYYKTLHRTLLIRTRNQKRKKLDNE